MAASVSGAVLSSLLFEQTNSKGDQEGFLLGQVVSRITDTISDTQLNNIKEEHTIYVNSFLPCKCIYSFYTSSGGISEEKLAKIILDKHKDVVGWYKFRRNSSPQVSMREKVVHQNLVNLFPGQQATHFLFSLFTTTTTTNISTHSFDYSIFQSQKGAFKGIPVHIVNLGDTAQSRYKTSTKNKGKQEATMYGGIIQQFESAFTGKSGEISQVDQIQEMNSTMHKKLRNLCHGITQSECEVEALVRDVERLRHRVKDREKHIEKTESLIDLKSASYTGTPKATVHVTHSIPIEMDKTLLNATDSTSVPSSLPASKPKKSDPFNFVDDLIKSHKDTTPIKKTIVKSSSLPRQAKLDSAYEKTKSNSLKGSTNTKSWNNGVSRNGDNRDNDSKSQDSSDDNTASPMSVENDNGEHLIPESMSPVY